MKVYSKILSFVRNLCSFNKDNTVFRMKLRRQREAILAAQWAIFNYDNRVQNFKEDKRFGDETKWILEWVSDARRRMIVFALMRAFFNTSKFSVTTTAKELGFSRTSVSKDISELRQLELIPTDSFIPSERMVKSFMLYTNRLISQRSLAKFSMNVSKIHMSHYLLGKPSQFNGTSTKLNTFLDDQDMIE